MDARANGTRAVVAATATWLVLAAAAASASVRGYELEVDGMACQRCARGLEAELTKLDGVHDVEVEVASGRVRFGVAPEHVVRPAAVRGGVREAGFETGGIRLEARGRLVESDDGLRIELGDGHRLPLSAGEALDTARKHAGERVELRAEAVERSGEWRLKPARVDPAPSDEDDPAPSDGPERRERRGDQRGVTSRGLVERRPASAPSRDPGASPAPARRGARGGAPPRVPGSGGTWGRAGARACGVVAVLACWPRS